MHLSRFLAQIFGHWISGMTGGLSLVLAVAALWLPTTPQRIGFMAVSILCVLISVYRVWLAADLRANDLSQQLLSARPVVVPEAVDDHDHLTIGLTNIGAEPALAITIASLRSFDGNAEFDTIQMLSPKDGQVFVRARFSQMADLRKVLGTIHLTAAMTGQREGREGTEFTIPLILHYSDVRGKMYEDRSFSFSWIPHTKAPNDTQFVIKRAT